MSKPYEFDGYTLRNATDDDEPLARVWTRADEHHQGIDPAFWLEKDKGTETYICERDGQPLFFVRLDKVVRMRIQFPPKPDKAGREELRNALSHGLNFLNIALSVRGFREVLFDSVAPLLRAFTIGRLKFVAKPATLSRILPSFRLPARDVRNTLQG